MLSIAGPGAILAYVVAGLVALAVAYATAEMVLAHPAAGRFGALVHSYLGHWAGFVVRWIYWTGMVTSAGSDAVAAGLYVQYWWPEVPLWAMAVPFSVLIFGINAFAVRVFGEAEYWFSMIKVTAIVAFIVIGVIVVAFGLPEQPAVGTGNLTSHGGFLPMGISGVWVATSIVIYSYGGTEGIAVMAAESQNPQRDMPRVARGMVLRLALFYVLSVAIIVTLRARTPTCTSPRG